MSSLQQNIAAYREYKKTGKVPDDSIYETILVRKCPVGQVHSINTGRCIKSEKIGTYRNSATNRLNKLQ